MVTLWQMATSCDPVTPCEYKHIIVRDYSINKYDTS